MYLIKLAYRLGGDDPLSQLARTRYQTYFGPLNSRHEGSIHYVVCADVDGDGVEETLCALMGADPPSWERTGVWCYKRKCARFLTAMQT